MSVTCPQEEDLFQQVTTYKASRIVPVFAIRYSSAVLRFTDYYQEDNVMKKAACVFELPCYHQNKVSNKTGKCRPCDDPNVEFKCPQAMESKSPDFILTSGTHDTTVPVNTLDHKSSDLKCQTCFEHMPLVAIPHQCPPCEITCKYTSDYGILDEYATMQLNNQLRQVCLKTVQYDDMNIKSLTDMSEASGAIHNGWKPTGRCSNVSGSVQGSIDVLFGFPCLESNDISALGSCKNVIQSRYSWNSGVPSNLILHAWTSSLIYLLFNTYYHNLYISLDSARVNILQPKENYAFYLQTITNTIPNVSNYLQWLQFGSQSDQVLITLPIHMLISHDIADLPQIITSYMNMFLYGHGSSNLSISIDWNQTIGVTPIQVHKGTSQIEFGSTTNQTLQAALQTLATQGGQEFDVDDEQTRIHFAYAPVTIKIDVVRWCSMLLVYGLYHQFWPDVSEPSVMQLFRTEGIFPLSQLDNIDIDDSKQRQTYKQNLNTYCTTTLETKSTTGSDLGKFILYQGNTAQCICWESNLAPVQHSTTGNITSMCFDQKCNDSILRSVYNLNDQTCINECNQLQSWLREKGNANQATNIGELDTTYTNTVCGTNYYTLNQIPAFNYKILAMALTLSVCGILICILATRNKQASFFMYYYSPILTGIALVTLSIVVSYLFSGQRMCDGKKKTCVTRLGVSLPTTLCTGDPMRTSCECIQDSDCGGSCSCKSGLCINDDIQRSSITVKRPSVSLVFHAWCTIIAICVMIVTMQLSSDRWFPNNKYVMIGGLTLITVIMGVSVIMTQIRTETQDQGQATCQS